LLLIAGASQLKAQQPLTFKADTALLKIPKSFMGLKPDDSALLKGFSNLPKAELLTNLTGWKSPDKNNDLFYSRMPVARLYSNDKMPVARLEGKDRMPVKKLTVLDPMAKPMQTVNP
ncbi:MAG: hypothetical protein ACXVAU_07650, partial [Mucilaginibacter sp.]